MFKLITQRLQRRGDEQGQILVIFGASLLVIVAMVGLVLDGGSAFAQRREQQNASDLAALAGANAYVLTNDESTARTAALTATADNGWTDGSGDVNVDVSFNYTNGVEVTVQVSAPHHNNFGAVVGLETMEVATTATAISGFPDTVEGAAPVIFSINAFDSNGRPKAAYGNPNVPYHFGEGNGDVPNGPGDIAWTNYGTGNVNTNEVRQIIKGDLVISKTLDFGEYIGQHNNGNHTALYSDVNQYLANTDAVVPVVDENGNFQGWAVFHIISASGGSAKDIVGYFKDGVVSQKLTVGSCQLNVDCPRYLGAYVLKLTD